MKKVSRTVLSPRVYQYSYYLYNISIMWEWKEMSSFPQSHFWKMKSWGS